MRDLVILGLGELGKLYGGAALAVGFRVTPGLRTTPLEPLLSGLTPRTPILCAVSEPALPALLSALPPGRSGDAILLQNELFPSLWAHKTEAPTVMIPWLLKKRGDPQIVIRPTWVWGRHADVVVSMHQALGIECLTLEDTGALSRELVHKYAFIITINALGVWRDRTLGRWLDEEPVRVRDLALEAASLGARLAGVRVDETRALEAVLQGMRALSTVSPRGRSAAARLSRAHGHAQRLGLETPLISLIAAQP